MKDSGDKGSPILDSGTSSFHRYSHGGSIYCREEAWLLSLPLKISLFQMANHKNSN